MGFDFVVEKAKKNDSLKIMTNLIIFFSKFVLPAKFAQDRLLTH